MEEELGDFQCPREHGGRTKTIRRLMFGYGFVFWLFVVQCSCSPFQPIATMPHGFVVLSNSHWVYVEHERADKPGYGLIRKYEFPFGHDFVLGDSVCIAAKDY